MLNSNNFKRLPIWVRRNVPLNEQIKNVRKILKKYNLNTVCDEARCPNKGVCFEKNTATFMILGKKCTRNCKFCSVTCESPEEIDPLEPIKIAQAVLELGLKYVVITSVTRDDLLDYGSEHFVNTIRTIKNFNPGIKIEVLVPDFLGKESEIKKVIKAHPDVFCHNIETVPRLYKDVRNGASYDRSLYVLNYVNKINPNLPTKSGLMVGLGENIDEIIKVMEDLYKINCWILTIGQYLQPTKFNLPVSKYYTPEEFEYLKEWAYKIGFKKVVSSPLVRSSFMAENIFPNSRH